MQTYILPFSKIPAAVCMRILACMCIRVHARDQEVLCQALRDITHELAPLDQDPAVQVSSRGEYP